MKRKPQPIDESRRRLLGNAFGLGVAGAGLATFGVVAARQPANPVQTTTHASSEYRETEHIRRYYRTTW